MSRLLRTELRKVWTTRTSAFLVAGSAAFAAFLGFATAQIAGDDGEPALGSPEMIERVLGVSTIPAAVALLLGVLLAAGEHQHGTITSTFLVTPVRSRVVAAKVAAAAVSGAVLTVVLVVAACAGAAPRVLAERAALDVDATGAVGVVAGLALAAAVLGPLGALLGLVLRSQTASLVLVAAWALVVEGIVDTVAGGGLREWLPGGAAATLAGGGDPEQPTAVAAAVLLAWTGALAAVAIPVVERGDVT